MLEAKAQNIYYLKFCVPILFCDYSIIFFPASVFGTRALNLIIFQLSCRGDTNECHNGGTAIWDPVKPYSCKCKGGYEGEFCEKGICEKFQFVF